MRVLQLSHPINRSSLSCLELRFCDFTHKIKKKTKRNLALASQLCPTDVAGEMAEWLKAHAWKACLLERVTWVRIPLSPPCFQQLG
jgi:hypothetical protein